VLTQYLNEVTARISRDEVDRDTSKATEVTTPLPPAGQARSRRFSQLMGDRRLRKLGFSPEGDPSVARKQFRYRR